MIAIFPNINARQRPETIWRKVQRWLCVCHITAPKINLPSMRSLSIPSHHSISGPYAERVLPRDLVKPISALRGYGTPYLWDADEVLRLNRFKTIAITVSRHIGYAAKPAKATTTKSLPFQRFLLITVWEHERRTFIHFLPKKQRNPVILISFPRL